MFRVRGILRRRLPLLLSLSLVFVGVTLVALPGSAQAADNTWLVNTADDAGGPCTTASCSLRAALAATNASTGSDAITFGIPGDGTPTITVSSALPALTGSDVTIDATTQSGGAVPGVVITLDGSVTAVVDGLQFNGSNITVRGFAITNFTGNGISITGSSTGDVIAGNWIGTRDGVTAAGNAGDGIHIVGGGRHTIGGLDPADANVVVGSLTSNGIEMSSSNANVVVGNIVGMSADGMTRLPNKNLGIGIFRTSRDNRIGGRTPAERNIVSGNNGIGVQLLGTLMADGTCQAPAFNVVEGNYIGLTRNGTKPAPFGNQGEGVQMAVCANNNLIGGTAPGARNVISGNHDDGVKLDNRDSRPGLICDNTIQGNYIGLTATGSAVAPNNDTGVKIQNGSCGTNLVGGDTPEAANVIVGNNSYGVYLKSQPSGSIVKGNIIGLAPDGVTPMPNGGGVVLFMGTRNAVVENNTIGASRANGVYLHDLNTNRNTIRGNRIGTTINGSTAGNAQYGIYLSNGPTDNVIDGNLIANSGLDAIAVEKIAGSTNTTVRNRITKNLLRANAGLGIELLPAAGVNAQDGTHLNAEVGNDGLDYPVITSATSTSAEGTAIPGTTVEVFEAAAGTGETNGEGDAYLGSTVAAGNGTWCLAGLNVSPGSTLTATATTPAGDTSEFGVNVTPDGSEDLCDAPPPPSQTLFADTFSGADGSALNNWDVRRSATGAGSGATIRSNQLSITDTLGSNQGGSWQYVQVRETAVQASWSAGTLSVSWQMATAANASQTSSLVLTPNATTGNATSQSDYLRVYVSNGKLFLVGRRAGGIATTLWSGTVPASSTVRDFEVRLDATKVTLLEGAPGATAVRIGPIPHNLGFTSGYAYLQASTNSLTSYVALFDTFSMVKSPGPPGSPSAVTATAGEGSAQVSWAAPASDGGDPITSYTVTSSAGQQVTVAADASGVVPTGATVGGLTAGTSYTFTVMATNQVGTGLASAPSNAVVPRAVLTVPGPPTGVVAQAGDSEARISWRAPASDGNTPITAYTVTASDGQQLLVSAAPDGTVPTTAVMQGLEDAVPYTFTVSATNAVGTGPDSAPSNTVTPLPGVTPPGAPTGVTATAGDASADVSWTPPADDGGSPITSYTVTSSAGDRVTVTADANGTVPTSATVTGLANGTGYTFVVTATNAVGPGDDSGPSNAVTPQGTPALPGAPTGVTATAGDSSAEVSWTPPASDGNRPITGYTVTSSAGDRVTVTADATGTVPTRTTVTGLTNGTSYTFTVSATNEVGTGPQSAPSSPVTPGLLFADDFTAADGSAPMNWEVRKSAAGAGSGATVQSSALTLNATLSSGQVGTWQYVQVREKVVQPDWSTRRISIAWQMSTAANATQTSSFALTPDATTGNALSQQDYLRVYVSNGKLFLVRNKGGTATTLWSGTITSSSGLRAFQVDLDATNVTLREGPVGSPAVRVGPVAHGLGFAAGHPYLQVSTNAAATYAGVFDNVTVLRHSS